MKATGFGDNRKATMQDLAILTGATVVSEDMGMKLEETQAGHLGKCKKVTITKNDTVLIDGVGDNTVINERCKEIKFQIVHFFFKLAQQNQQY